MAGVKKAENNSGREFSYEEIVKTIRSMKGSQSIIGEKEIHEQCRIERIPTGIPTIDYMGSGGITEGRITILAGNISSCKTTATLQCVAAIQRWLKARGQMKMILYYDPEGAFEESYAKALGVDTNWIIVKRSNRVIEDVFAEIDNLVSTGFIGGLVIDSLDGLIARKVEDSEYGNTMGGAAGAVAMHLPTLYSKLLEHNITTIFIKQARVKLDAYGAKGEVLTFSGGKALRHFADSIYIVKRLSNKNLNYTPIQIKGDKTRSARMGMVLEMPNGVCGIDVKRDLMNIAIMHGLIEQAGSWLTYKDKLKAQGSEKFLEALKDEAIYKVLHDDVYENIIAVYSLVGQSTSELIVEEED